MSCAHPSPHPCGRQSEAWKASGMLIGKYEDEDVPELEEGCFVREEWKQESGSQSRLLSVSRLIAILGTQSATQRE